MGDVDENILNERRGPPDPPTREDIREWASEHLREGMDAEPGERTHTDCPECGHRVVTGRESMGPEFEGFDDTLREVADMFGGEFTDEEFRDLARDVFEDALSAVLDDEGPRLDAEAHETLDTFHGPTLTFSRSLAPRLLDGSKNATVRYDLDEEIRPGEEVVLRTPGAIGEFGTATVADVIRTDLSDALDAIADEGYRHNAEDLPDLWFDLNLYYEDSLGLTTTVAVVLLDDVTEEVR